MAHLEYLVDGTGHEAKLEKVDTFIGRSPDCEIELSQDGELSRVHCSVQRQSDGSYVLVDEASKNGTYLNDELIFKEEKPLKDGDRIRVGHTVLTFREQEEVGRTGKLFGEVEQQMEKGEGYHTILGKIIKQEHKHKRKHKSE